MEFEELTHKIIGCAMQVHRTLGNGFQEVIYQRALALEFDHQGIEYDREKGGLFTAVILKLELVE